ncbi:MAG: hypothetical protein M3Z11_02480 [Candidatus Dormibacteraeota bacterium]|nr:hypothetical protein [Candidatus Dormibacteraeota bacterium]
MHFTDDGYGHPISLPQVSTSNDRLYYLDGDARVRFLGIDGTTGLAHALEVGHLSRAAFAVSPDNRRIAVTIVDYPSVSTGPVRIRLYVEDLTGGTHRIDLFESSSMLEWPVGWHAGQLVIGVASVPYGQNQCEICAYRPQEYHVVDATSGRRLATLCPAASGGFSVTLPTPAGIECDVHSGDGSHQSLLQGWDGTSRTIPSDLCGIGGQLSPDGLRLATTTLPQWANGGCTGSASITLIDPYGRRVSTLAQGTPEGWLDPTHLIFQRPQGGSAILDSSSGQTIPVGTLGTMVGSLPGNLG